MNEDKLLEMSKKLVEILNDNDESDLIYDLLEDEGFNEEEIEEFIEECYK